MKKYEEVILNLYSTKLASPLLAPEPLRIPAAALVGEALYDLHAGELEMMSARLEALSCSDDAIKNERILTTAHRLGLYVKLHRPDLLPRKLKLYLYCCGDRIEDTLEEMLNDIGLLKETGLYEHLYNYLYQTREEFPERWQKIQEHKL